MKTQNPRLRAASLLAALGTFVSASSLHAQTNHNWTGITDRNWATTTNWSPSPVFSNSRTYTFGSATNTSLAAPSFIGVSRTVGTIIFSDAADSDIGIRLTDTAESSSGRILNVWGGVTVDTGSAGNHTIGVGGHGNFRLRSSSGNGSITIAHNGTGILTIAAGIDQGETGNAIEKTGTGTLVFSAVNSYTGNTVVSAGTLTLTSTSEQRFVLGDGGAGNRLSGAGAVNLNGTLRLDVSSVTATSGIWNLVNVETLTTSFNAGTFGLAFVDGPAFANAGGGLYTSGDWTFDTSTGSLTLGTIPEPAAAALLLGLAAFAATARRRRV